MPSYVAENPLAGNRTWRMNMATEYGKPCECGGMFYPTTAHQVFIEVGGRPLPQEEREDRQCDRCSRMLFELKLHERLEVA